MRLALIAALMPLPAMAQVQCFPLEEVFARLEVEHGESARFIGPGSNNIVHVWLNEENGSWTITVSDASGQACVVAFGMSGELLAPRIPGIDG